MYTYFTDLNKCCPKDNYPLARIDQIVNTAAGSETMALLDYFLGVPSDLASRGSETSFISTFGTYCYLRMPEGLCNVGSTFCRMMKVALKD
jgi:hypothetical protein